jgi:hypothetical protein
MFLRRPSYRPSRVLKPFGPRVLGGPNSKLLARPSRGVRVRKPSAEHRNLFAKSYRQTARLRFAGSTFGPTSKIDATRALLSENGNSVTTDGFQVEPKSTHSFAS